MEKKYKISEKLQKARTYEKEQLEHRSMAEKQSFHVCAPVGWINDPNGFSEYQGEKHLFFQYHPYSTSWGPMHWGHMKTSDFIKWQQLPVALAPDEKYDGFGCFSGSAMEWNGKHVLAYTSVERTILDGKNMDYQRQCIAIGDGINYEKIPQNPVISGNQIPEGGSTLDFRDPKIWLEGDWVNMVVGNRAKDGSGQILLYRSKNLKKWEFITVLDKSNNRYGKMWECPDLFTLDGQDVLLTSPQEMLEEKYEFHAGDGTIYILGDYDKGTDKFTEHIVRAVDMGLDFYAPQTMKTSDGRRIMIGWMQSWCTSWFSETDGFCGMMSIPRELQVRGGILCQNPVRELEKYYSNKQIVEREVLSNNYKEYTALRGREQNLDLTIEGDADYVFEMRLAANQDYESTIRYERASQLLTFDRSRSGVRKDAANVRTIKVISDYTQLKLRIVMDRYSIEIFVNDGEQAMTSVIRTDYCADGVFMRADKTAYVCAEKNDIQVKSR